MKLLNKHIIFLLENKIIYVLIIIPLILFIYSCQEKESTSIIDIEHIPATIETKNEIEAGELIRLNINSTTSSQLYLILTNRLGTSILEINNLNFTLPIIYSETSGVLWLELFTHHKLLDSKKIKINPKEAILDITSFIGPKSIITTQKEPCMLISIPVDTFDNPVKDKSIAVHKMLRPNNQLERYEIKTEHLISHHTFYAQEKTGKTLIGIRCDKANSIEKYVDEEPGWPHLISLQKEKNTLIADGKHYSTIRTNIIKDKIGNIVMDGTIVTFLLIDQENRQSQYSSSTIDGIAKIQFKHPTISSKYEIKVFSGNAISDPIYLQFESNINEFPIQYKNNSKSILIGPITTYLDQFIPDGSEIKITIIQNNKTIYEKINQTDKGKFRLELDELFISNNKINIEVSYSDINIRKNLILE